MTAMPEISPDLTPTERAVANMRALRAAAGYPLASDEWLPLTAYDQLEAEAQELRAKAAVDAKQIGELETELERVKRPSYSTQHVWTVWRDERPIHALYATEDDAKQGSIDCWEEDEESCPDYSWKVHAHGRLELLVGGELAGVYISRTDVFSKAMADERNATGVTA